MLDIFTDLIDTTSDVSARLAMLDGNVGEDLQAEPKKLRKQISELKQLARDSFTSLKSSSAEMRAKNTQKVKEKFKKLKQKANTAKFTRYKDKITFLVTTMRLILGTYVLGSMPCHYPEFYIFSAIALLTMRMFYYRAINYHYFMVEFCYYANLVCTVFLWYNPTSAIFYNVCMAFAFGPLLLAGFLFKNSLVPHHLDIVTSHFIHTSPALVLWGTHSCSARFPNLVALPFWQYLGYGFLAYSLWFIVYTILMFMLTYERSVRKNNVTLYNYTMNQRGVMSLLPMRVSEQARPVIYMIQHMLSTHLFMALGYVFLLDYTLMTVALLAMFSISVWNGGDYYIEYFSRRYDSKLQQVEELTKQLEAKQGDPAGNGAEDK